MTEEEKSLLINDLCDGLPYRVIVNFKKEVPKKYYGEITHKSDWEKHIEHMLSDDWEGNEEIFVSEDECSKPFNTPKILGCVDNINDIIE